MRPIDLLYYGLLGIGLILMICAWRSYSKTTDLRRAGATTTAVVIDLIPQSSSDGGPTYSPVFEYQHKYKGEQTFESDVSSSPAPYDIGEKVSIIYHLEEDEQRVVSFWGLYRWAIVLTCIASPMLIIGGGYCLYMRG